MIRRYIDLGSEGCGRLVMTQAFYPQGNGEVLWIFDSGGTEVDGIEDGLAWRGSVGGKPY